MFHSSHYNFNFSFFEMEANDGQLPGQFIEDICRIKKAADQSEGDFWCKSGKIIHNILAFLVQCFNILTKRNKKKCAESLNDSLVDAVVAVLTSMKPIHTEPRSNCGRTEYYYGHHALRSIFAEFNDQVRTVGLQYAYASTVVAKKYKRHQKKHRSVCE